jgi:hypothetical protein
MIAIYLFSHEISRYFGLNIHFTSGLGGTSVVASLVKLGFPILHSFGAVLSLWQIRATTRVMRYFYGE